MRLAKNPVVVPLTEEGGRDCAVPMRLGPIVFFARMGLLEQAGSPGCSRRWSRPTSAFGEIA